MFAVGVEEKDADVRTAVMKSTSHGFAAKIPAWRCGRELRGLSCRATTLRQSSVIQWWLGLHGATRSIGEIKSKSSKARINSF